MGIQHNGPNRHARHLTMLVAAALLATACGSRLDREEHLALNSSVVVQDAGVAAPSPGGDVGEADRPTTDSGTARPGPGTATGGATPGPVTAAPGTSNNNANAGHAGGTPTTPAAPGQEPTAPSDESADQDQPADRGSDDQGGGAPAAPSGGEPTGPATLSPVTIGNIGTYSGIAGAILQSGQEGIQIWAAWANQNGGLGGHQVNLLTQDDAGDPARAQSLVRNMVENQGAIAMVSNLTVFTTASYRPILEQNNVPLVGGDLLTADYFESPMMFPQGSSYRTSVLGTLKIGVERGQDKLGVIYCSEVPPICDVGASIMNNDAEAELGSPVVYSVSASLAQPDFTSECLGARDAGVTNLQLFLDGNSVRRAIDACTNQGYTPLFSTNTIALTEAVLQSPNVNGLVAGGQVFPPVANDTPGAQKFQQAYADYAGKAPQAGSASLAWTAGRLLQKATAATFGEGQPTAQDVLDGLATIKDETLEGLTVPLDFTTGQKIAPECVFPVEVQEQQFVAPQGSSTVCL